MQAVTLFGYAFLSNVALAMLPHEPAVIWYGARLGVWPTTLVATAGTVAAALVDHRVFVPLIARADVSPGRLGAAAAAGGGRAAGRGGDPRPSHHAWRARRARRRRRVRAVTLQRGMALGRERVPRGAVAG